METDVKPKKSDLYDHRAVIKYAAQQAVEKGKTFYVVAQDAKWTCVGEQPHPRWSHWKVDHMAELTAHLGGYDVTEYNYESAGSA